MMRRVDARRDVALLASAFAAFSRRMRAMTMPLSVELRFSFVRSAIGPMLSCKEASCMPMPSMPL